MYLPGNILFLEGMGIFAPGVECIITEVCPIDGHIKKIKAVHPDERLGKHGFLLEGEDWVCVEWEYSRN